MPRRFDILLSKFYKPIEQGAWVTANQHPHHPKYNQKGSSKNLSALIAIANSRNDVIYHQIELNTILCGIPFKSKSAYFEKGDIPIGHFQKNGIEHLVIYSYVVDGKGSFE